MAQTVSAAIRSPIFWCSENAPANSRQSLLTVSDAITRAALERKESRGAQFREDYPNRDEQFGKVNTVISKTEDGLMQISLEPLPEMPDHLKQIIEEMK